LRCDVSEMKLAVNWGANNLGDPGRRTYEYEAGRHEASWAAGICLPDPPVRHFFSCDHRFSIQMKEKAESISAH
jgi:hypothetical protein